MVRRLGLLGLLVLWLGGVAHAQLAMHIVLMGDSNTFLGGDACDKPEGWNKWFRDLAEPLSCRSYARSGATWTHTPKTVYDTEEYTGVLSDNNVVYNQINRLTEAYRAGEQPAPDLIVIMAGTNDLWFAEQRPDSLSRWIRYDGECIGKVFPQARVVLVTPPPFVKVGMDRQRRAAEEMAECARDLGWEVVRLDRADHMFRASDMRRLGYSKDGVHTTVAGAKVLGRCIYEQIKAILHQ